MRQDAGTDLLGEDRRRGSFCEFHGGGAEELQPGPAYMILYLPGTLAGEGLAVDRAKGELYHLSDDPYEWKNLYDEPACAAVREAMKTELLMHLARAWARGPFYYDQKGFGKLGRV